MTTREFPLVFTTSSVRAILDGIKTQTRRVITCSNSYVDGRRWGGNKFEDLDLSSPKVYYDDGPSPAGNLGPYLHVPCREYSSLSERGLVHRVYPIVQPGDRIWVKETWVPMCNKTEDPFCCETDEQHILDHHYIEYRADTGNDRPGNWPADDYEGPLWKSSYLMRRDQSRLTLDVIDVRTQRVQDISDDDATADGIRNVRMHLVGYAREQFKKSWDRLNGVRRNGDYSWARNRFVWVYTFKVASR